MPTLIKSFNKYSKTYDHHSSIQSQIGHMLMRGLKTTNPKSILEIGCGPGTLTRHLKKKFPDATLTAIDSAPNMIKEAKRQLSDDINWISCDANSFSQNMPTKPDLIISNATLQWDPNWKKVIRQCHKNSKAEMALSMFGPSTFIELQTIINQRFPDTKLPSEAFPKKEDVYKELKKNDYQVKSTSVELTKLFPTLKDLLLEIRQAGLQGAQKSHGLWTPRLINQLENIYKTQYTQIRASYFISLFWGTHD